MCVPTISIFQNTNYFLFIVWNFSSSFVEIVNTPQFQMEIISHHLHILPNTVQFSIFIAIPSFPASDLYSDRFLPHWFVSFSCMPSFLDDKHAHRCLVHWLIHVFLYRYRMNFQSQFTNYSQSFRFLWTIIFPKTYKHQMLSLAHCYLKRR